MQMLSRAARTHRHVSADFAALALFIVAAGCSGRDSTSPPPGHQDEWSAIADRAWTMPGETEAYRCVGVHVTSDEYLTGFRLAAPSQVQNEVMLTVLSTPVTEGAFDCNAGSLGAELIYAASLGTTAIQFPAGFGVHVSAGQYLLLNIHLVNLADTSVSDSTRLEALIGTASEVTTPIGMSLGGTFLINIPNDGQEHTASGQCAAVTDVHVLALLPLMRSRGVHQTVKVVANATPQVLFDQDFDFQHITYTQFTPPFLIPMGSSIQTTCSYVNTGGQTETFGESATNESCFSAMYRYPISTSGNLYGCATVNGGDFDIRRE